MRRLAEFLSGKWASIGFGLAMLAIGAGFGPIQAQFDGTLLDMITDGESARGFIAWMTPEQRTLHFWTTVLLDTAYPIAYVGFFAGLAARFSGDKAGLAMLPALMTGIVDLAENAIQAMALAGGADFLDLKAVLTPLKFGGVMLSAVLALVLVVVGVGRRILKR